MMKRCILVVDDDSDDIELLIEAVQEIDPTLHCHSALNGRDALALLDLISTKPEIIFVDLNMPILNGKEFIKAVRENKANDRIKIFLYSTIDLNRDLLELKAIGANGFFRKPISYAALCKELSIVIRNCLNHPV
jgi:CheY-like chemotaxis protein